MSPETCNLKTRKYKSTGGLTHTMRQHTSHFKWIMAHSFPQELSFPITAKA